MRFSSYEARQNGIIFYPRFQYLLIMFNHPKLQLLKNHFLLSTIPRAFVAIFVLLQIAAMMVYPGGTIHDETTVGHSFTKNFFSDLGTYATQNGSPNFYSMILFCFALVLVGTIFILYYLALPQLFLEDKNMYWFSVAGSIFAFGGSLSLIGTGLTPSDLYLDAHIIFANWIFRAFLVTAFCYTVVILRTDVLPNKYAVGYGIFTALIAIYVGVSEFGPEPRDSEWAMIFQVVAQKMIVLTFCLSVVYQTFGFSDKKAAILDK